MERRLWRRWLRREPARSWYHDDRLLTIEQMRDTIARERLRTDRSGLPFALVAVAPAHGEADEPMRQLIAHLTMRLRATDEMGRWSGQSLGLLLPYTDRRGAWCVADDVRAHWTGAEPLTLRVYVYPTHSPPESEAEQTPHERELEEREALPIEVLMVQTLPAWKRAVDVVGAVTGLALLSPLLLTAAAAIRLNSPGPVLFRQQRDGAGGVPFTIFKFRTMYQDAEARKAELMEQNEQDGPAFKLANDPRVTFVGRILRKTCIDELPQLWNVLRGEMSLVGPRPMDSRESAQCRSWERRRLDVTPGITCIWQVHGGARVSFAEWMRMDLRYIRGRSIRRDVRLLLETVATVLIPGWSRKIH